MRSDTHDIESSPDLSDVTQDHRRDPDASDAFDPPRRPPPGRRHRGALGFRSSHPCETSGATWSVGDPPPSMEGASSSPATPSPRPSLFAKRGSRSWGPRAERMGCCFE